MKWEVGGSMKWEVGSGVEMTLLQPPGTAIWSQPGKLMRVAFLRGSFPCRNPQAEVLRHPAMAIGLVKGVLGSFYRTKGPTCMSFSAGSVPRGELLGYSSGLFCTLARFWGPA